MTNWEIKFKGDWAPTIVEAPTFEDVFAIVKEKWPQKEIVKIAYLCY